MDAHEQRGEASPIDDRLVVSSGLTCSGQVRVQSVLVPAYRQVVRAVSPLVSRLLSGPLLLWPGDSVPPCPGSPSSSPPQGYHARPRLPAGSACVCLPYNFVVGGLRLYRSPSARIAVRTFSS